LTSEESRKNKRIADLAKAGLRPRLEILSHGLDSEAEAFRIEAAVIDLLGLPKLLNQVRGMDSLRFGRLPLDDVISYYAAKPISIDDPVILIRVNHLYYHGITDAELYDATRRAWRLSRTRCRKAKYVLSVFQGVVREVYMVEEDGWDREGTTPDRSRIHPKPPNSRSGRLEFRGRPADDGLRGKYRLRSVRQYLRKAAQNPIQYVNC